MDVTLRPQPAVIGIWRSYLVCATLLPAFFCSLFLRPGSGIWTALTCFWIAVFLFFYLFYLPMRFNRLSLRVAEDALSLTAGVFINLTRTVPFESVQFITLSASPLHRLRGLCSLRIVAPGGRISMPGLRTEESNIILRILENRN